MLLKYVSIPDGMGNMTVLESMGYKNISALDTQVQDEAPSGYIGGTRRITPAGTVARRFSLPSLAS